MNVRNCLIVFLLLSGNIYAQTDPASFTYQKPLFDFDYTKPVFKLEDEQLTNANRYLRGSVITGYREGVKPIDGGFGTIFQRYNLAPATGLARIAMYNVSIIEMLSLRTVNPNMVVLEVKDPSRYMYLPEYGDKLSWMRKNTYCYEVILPVAAFDGAPVLKRIKDEQTEFFGVQFTREKRTIKTLVLVRTSNLDKIKSKGVNTGANGTIDAHGNFNNVRLTQMNDFLNQTSLPFLVDETGYKDYVDMNLNIEDWGDLKALRIALQRYDLDLKEEMREVKDVYVIKEIKR